MKKFLCFLLSVILTLSLVVSIAETTVPVPKDAATFNGHSYKVIMRKRTWNAAKDDCTSLGGHLVTITSAEEQKFVYSLIKSLNADAFWIGFTDADEEGNWRWVTGEAVTYTNWGKGQPNNNDGDAQNYADIYIKPQNWGKNNSVKAGQWDDDAGEEPRPYICEWDEADPDAGKVTIKGLKYELNVANRTAAFSGIEDPQATSVTIPATIKVEGTKFTVTEIKADACSNMKAITKLTIGVNVSKIGANAFDGCEAITKITIKTTKLTKKSVGVNAFNLGNSKKATVKCPKGTAKNYQKILKKKGLGNATYK